MSVQSLLLSAQLLLVTSMISFTGAVMSAASPMPPAAWLMPEKAIRLAITMAIVFMVECPERQIAADTS
ncbi:hypothetical protein GCM10007919_10900 [Rhizobium indigoferae]|nr:hypothetical protein GCM10007919_10900 [Rhizobium indigoferae]